MNLLVYIWMSKSLVGSDALIRIKLQQTSQQIQAIFARIRHELLNGLFGSVRGALDNTGPVMRLNAFDIELARRRYVLQNAFELIECGRAWEHGRAEQHLAENAAYAPHVYAFCVLGRGEQDLGRAVPARGHVLGESRIRRRVLVVARLLCERTRQPEIAQLHVTFLIEQYVRWLLIPVYHVGRV